MGFNSSNYDLRISKIYLFRVLNLRKKRDQKITSGLKKPITNGGRAAFRLGVPPLNTPFSPPHPPFVEPLVEKGLPGNFSQRGSVNSSIFQKKLVCYDFDSSSDSFSDNSDSFKNNFLAKHSVAFDNSISHNLLHNNSNIHKKCFQIIYQHQ